MASLLEPFGGAPLPPPPPPSLARTYRIALIDESAKAEGSPQQCTTPCKITKPSSEFYVRTGRGARMSVCKACHLATVQKRGKPCQR